MRNLTDMPEQNSTDAPDPLVAVACCVGLVASLLDA